MISAVVFWEQSDGCRASFEKSPPTRANRRHLGRAGRVNGRRRRRFRRPYLGNRNTPSRYGRAIIPWNSGRGFLLRWVRVGLRKWRKSRLTFTFREILGDGAPDKHYDFRDLTTIDGLLDDIYRTALTGIVRPRSYAAEDGWILATKGGEALWNIGSDWAKRTGVLPA